MANNIFYHMYCVNDALERFNNTYLKIQKSDLINHIDNIFVNCVGSEKEYNSTQIKSLNKVVANIGIHDKDESETLNILRDFSLKNNDGYSLYLHTKGVTTPYDEKKNLHKDCMEYFLIEQFATCFDILKNHDNCGVFFVAGPSWSCYGGNFWWSTNKYLSTLSKCENKTRFESEAQFLKPAQSRYKNLYNPPKPFFAMPIYRSLYTKSEPL